VKRSPLDLAAVATAAIPGLSAARVGWLPDDREDFDSAIVIDTQGGRWRVRSPKHADASLRLETELRALGGLSPAVRATLPFAVPSVAGTVRRGELKTFVYHHLDGHVLGLDELSSSDLTAQLGRAIAAIHATAPDTVERAGLSSETAEEYRRARLSELDHAATSGKVPSRLLRRWEAAMEDVSLWRFNATVVHGDLHEEQIFVHEGRLVAVTGWSDLHVGDPAEDLAWLLALDDQRVIDAVVESYSSWRGDKADPHLMKRATLAAEFALARWLSRAVTRGDAARVAEAVGLLEELDANLRELGDRPIGLVEAGPSPSTPPAAGDDAAPETSAPAAEPVVELPDDAPAPGATPAGTAPVGTQDETPAVTTAAAAAPAEEPAKDPAEDSLKEAAPSLDDAPTGEATTSVEDDDADAVITDADAAEPATDAIPVITPPAADPEPPTDAIPTVAANRDGRSDRASSSAPQESGAQKESPQEATAPDESEEDKAEEKDDPAS